MNQVYFASTYFDPTYGYTYIAYPCATVTPCAVDELEEKAKPRQTQKHKDTARKTRILDERRCTAMTKKGEPCKNYKQRGEGCMFCAVHAKPLPKIDETQTSYYVEEIEYTYKKTTWFQRFKNFFANM
uniref:Uncharacterized protein n=1 Tax=viral metagenome TaxID=1070528 RepID=A0A6C0IRQ2_9ZZZZ